MSLHARYSVIVTLVSVSIAAGCALPVFAEDMPPPPSGMSSGGMMMPPPPSGGGSYGGSYGTPPPSSGGGGGGSMPAGMPSGNMNGGTMPQGGMMPSSGGTMQGNMSAEQTQQMQQMQKIQMGQPMMGKDMQKDMQMRSQMQMPSGGTQGGMPATMQGTMPNMPSMQTGQMREMQMKEMMMQGGSQKSQMQGMMNRGMNQMNQGMMNAQGSQGSMEQDTSAQDSAREAAMKKQQLAQWAKQSVQYEKQISKLRSNLERAKKKKEVAQYANIVSRVESEVAAVEAKWSEIKGLAASEDIEGVMDAVSDLHDAFGDAQRSIEFIAQLGSVAKMTKNADREITRFEKDVARLEKKGTDVGAIRSAVAEGRAKLKELQDLSQKSDAAPEDFFDLMQEVGDIKTRAMEEFNKASGKPESAALGAAVFQAIEARRLGF